MLEAIIALPTDIFYNTPIQTYIWVLSNKKRGTKREGKIQLINASGLYEKRRKALGNKRNDIPDAAIEEITRLYGDFKESELSKIFDNEDFGYTKITVERPLRDENGELVLKSGKKQADSALRDTENVPLKEDIQEYFKREVLPYAPDAWIDTKKSTVGYEIPFVRYFYKYEAPKPSSKIMAEIVALEKELKTGNFIVSFIDLLGAKEGMKTDSNGMLIKIHDAYNESIDAYNDMFGKYPEDVNYRIFSDNIIVFCQYESVDISEAFKVIVLLSSLIQIQFMLKDYIVRGGISTGDFYFDDVMVWGNALSKAYYIESKLSVYVPAPFYDIRAEQHHKFA